MFVEKNNEEIMSNMVDDGITITDEIEDLKDKIKRDKEDLVKSLDKLEDLETETFTEDNKRKIDDHKKKIKQEIEDIKKSINDHEDQIEEFKKKVNDLKS